MQSKDSVQRFVFENLDARGCAVTLNDTVEGIQQTHHYPPHLAQTLNEFALAAVLLHDSLKIACSVTIQLRNTSEEDAAINLVMADCMFDRHVRAIAEYDNEKLTASLPINLSELSNALVLAITITPEEGERYQSIVAMEHASLAQCLEEYFVQSEQLPTWFKFFAERDKAFGLALHGLPKEKVLDEAVAKQSFGELKILVDTLTAKEALELTHQEILTRLFHQEPCRLFTEKPVQYGCVCSAQKSLQAIKSLGQEEVVAMLAEQQSEGNNSIFVDCHFCFQQYEFELSELENLFSQE